MIGFLKKIKHFLPIIFTVCLLVLFYFKRYVVIKYYPICMNFLFFAIFFSSLFAKETIIQKFARMMDGELKPKVAIYTKNVTYIWCVFIFLNLIMSIITFFLPDEIWLWYNGCISYILMGILFSVEYIVRILFRKRHSL